MKQLNQDMKDNNMFLVLEAYLAHPTTKIAKKIKVLSHALTLQAISEAEKQFPNKKIGADEYQPI